MTTLYFYRDDYIESPRETEDSNKVVHLWYDERARYADEDISDDQCMGLVAERVIVRRLLGIETLDMVYMSKASRAKPFGPDAPMLAELLMPGTFVAMALVPLSPQGSQGRPIVARLYCVAGLSNRHVVSLDGMDEKVLQGFSWFLAGVPQGYLKKGVAGRSWLLAANLLARIVERRDIKTARNLAKHYIVTGDVLDGAIRRVEMLRKPELAKKFDNFKWIIPKENDMDIPKRKIEKPKTLEEAYQMIESMRSTATKSLFRFLRKGDLPGVQEQYRIGADLFAREENTNLACLEVLANEKAQLYAKKESPKKAAGVGETGEDDVRVNLESFKKEIRDRIAMLDEISQWLRLQGADPAMTFYLMAVNGDEAGIIRTSAYTSINACDEHGLTAVDFALMGEKFEVARLLHRYGGVPNSRWAANSELRKAIDCLCDPTIFSSVSQNNLIVNAIEVGLSPEICVYIPRYDYGFSESAMPGLQCTLFAAAVRHANYEVLEACFKCGSDANKMLMWTRPDVDPWGEPYDAIEEQGTPWSILSARKDMTGEKRQKFLELLLRYGANISEE